MRRSLVALQLLLDHGGDIEAECDVTNLFVVNTLALYSIRSEGALPYL